jgi:hypothetical protein
MKESSEAEIVISTLHPFEMWLIRKWRTKYRFGEITISVQNGVPQRIKKVIVSDDPRDDNVHEGPQSKQ